MSPNNKSTPLTSFEIPVELLKTESPDTSAYDLQKFFSAVKSAHVVGHEMLIGVKELSSDFSVPTDGLRESICFRINNDNYEVSLTFEILHGPQEELFNFPIDDFKNSSKQLIAETSRLLTESSIKSAEGIIHTVSSDANSGKTETETVFSQNTLAVKSANKILGKNKNEDNKNEVVVKLDDQEQTKMTVGGEKFLSSKKDTDFITFSGLVGYVDTIDHKLKIKPISGLSHKSIIVNINPQMERELLKLQEQESIIKFTCKRLVSTNNVSKSTTYELEYYVEEPESTLI